MDTFELQLSSGRRISVLLRRSERAQRIRLRVTEKGPELVVPYHIPEELALRFAKEQRIWLESVLQKRPVRKIMRPEVLELAFTGEHLRIEYAERDVVWTGVRYQSPDSLLVSGRVAEVRDCIQALRSWLKRKAVVEIRPFAADLCSEFDFEISGFTIGLQRRVWGTCSAKRKIALNSALLFFPKEIVRYVVIHEGCHLTEMNHSQRFWNLVRRYDSHPERARKILNAPNSVPAWVHAKFDEPISE